MVRATGSYPAGRRFEPYMAHLKMKMIGLIVFGKCLRKTKTSLEIHAWIKEIGEQKVCESDA